ncbi:MAG: hypothetical protein KAT77_05965 [Nanoarchaeota archaeon]|nr:hypothetical protein [Nanoarchaeota archaeon]
MKLLEKEGVKVISALGGGSHPVYLGNFDGKKVVTKECSKREIDLVKALIDIGVDTAQILDVNGSQVIFEYIDEPNLAERGDINQDVLAESLADFHSKLYENRHKLKDVLEQKPLGERVKGKIKEIEKESFLERAVKSVFSGTITDYLRKDFDRLIESLTEQIPDEVSHNDIRNYNIMGDGSRYVLIDMDQVGDGYFGSDLARAAMELKAAGKKLDEKRFKEKYLEKLSVKKTAEDFDKEYLLGKKLTGLWKATSYLRLAEKDLDKREEYNGYVETYVKETLGAMSPEERDKFVDNLNVNGYRNRYGKRFLQIAKDYERENDSLINRLGKGLGRKFAKFAAVAGLTAAVTLGTCGYIIKTGHESMRNVEQIKAEETMKNMKREIYLDNTPTAESEAEKKFQKWLKNDDYSVKKILSDGLVK